MGLGGAQLAALHWDEAKPGLPLFRQLIRDRIEEATTARAEIREAPDDTRRSIQEARHRTIESRVAPVRQVADAVIGAFFFADKPRPREKRRAEAESWLTGAARPQWEKFEASAAALRRGELAVFPFHWELEFPEVFARENPGFDAIIGNPPFLGGKRISEQLGERYRDWLGTLHSRSSRNVDLVGHFFLRAFAKLRTRGVLGLIGTNTLAQGDTREGSLAIILGDGGEVGRAQKRIRWPGEAAVVVSVVHIVKGPSHSSLLNGKPVHRISAYLVEGNFDHSPSPLVANSRKAYVGSYVLGMGFTFDDEAASKGVGSSLGDMERLLSANQTNAQRIFPYLGGEELNNDPRQRHMRYVIDFEDISLADARAGWPELVAVLERLVKLERAKQKREDLRKRWWQFAYRKNNLYLASSRLTHILALSRVSPMLALARIPARLVAADSMVVFAFEQLAPFAVLQSRVHELWARFFSSSMKDDLRYTPSDCFRTFPFPEGFASDTALEAIGNSYYAHRANLMVARGEGLTKTYNRFHARGEHSADIARLRALHAEMDMAVLRAYGWDDLAARAVPEFIEQDADEGKKPKTRLDWPAEFKDEVLGRLLALNVERAAAERAQGLAPVSEEDEETEIGDDESEEDVPA